MITCQMIIFQATGLGGTVSQGHDTSKIETMQAVQERVITVRFNADVASSMMWNFKPQQIEVKVCLLAFLGVPILVLSAVNIYIYNIMQTCAVLPTFLAAVLQLMDSVVDFVMLQRLLRLKSNPDMGTRAHTHTLRHIFAQSPSIWLLDIMTIMAVAWEHVMVM